MKKIFIFTNDIEQSRAIEHELRKRLPEAGFELVEGIQNADFIFNIGGDGTLLGLMHEFSFPTTPIVGINTGHLGFFQEVSPDTLDHFIEEFSAGKYRIQPYNIAKAVIERGNEFIELRALNEFTIKSGTSHSIHLNISINDSFIEKFSGDGLDVATPAGSTAYNYSLGGAVVDPRVNILEVTPIAPMNTTAFRSLTSSIILPGSDNLVIEPYADTDRTVQLLYDGYEQIITDIKRITLTLSRRKINLVRFDDYTFWDKVKEKFL